MNLFMHLSRIGLSPFLPCFTGFLQMLHDRQLGSEGKHEIRPHTRPFPELTDVQLHVLIADDDVMFIGKGFHPCGKLCGISPNRPADTGCTARCRITGATGRCRSPG